MAELCKMNCDREKWEVRRITVVYIISSVMKLTFLVMYQQKYVELTSPIFAYLF